MIVSLVLTVVICAFVLNFFYKRTNHYNNQFLDVKKIQDSVKNGDKFQIVNLGSNHPKFAFDYSVSSSVKGANWAIGPQTVEYDFAVLRRFRSYLADNAIVVLPICLKNFFLYRQENRAIHAKYYTFLPKEDIVGYSLLEKLKFIDFPIFFQPILMKRLIYDVKKDNRLLLTSNPMLTNDQLQNDAHLWIECWDREFGVSSTSFEISEKNKSDIEKNIGILKDIIKWCQAEGLRPVITLIPVSGYLAEKFSPEYLNEHLYKYIELSNEAGIPIFDYLNNINLKDAKYYINSFFYNKIGRKAFSKLFINDLRGRNLIC